MMADCLVIMTELRSDPLKTAWIKDNLQNSLSFRTQGELETAALPSILHTIQINEEVIIIFALGNISHLLWLAASLTLFHLWVIMAVGREILLIKFTLSFRELFFWFFYTDILSRFLLYWTNNFTCNSYNCYSTPQILLCFLLIKLFFKIISVTLGCFCL